MCICSKRTFTVVTILLFFGSFHGLEIKSKHGGTISNFVPQGQDRNGNPIYLDTNTGENVIYNGQHYYKIIKEDDFEILPSNPQHKHGGRISTYLFIQYIQHFSNISTYQIR